MADQVAGEEKTGLDIAFRQLPRHFVAGDAGVLPDGNQEAEPGGNTVFGRFGENQAALCGNQHPAERVPVLPAFLDEGREFFQLFHADGGLQVRGLQIVPEMAVDILVIIALREFPVMAVKPVPAEIVLSGRAHAVAAPVAEGADQLC